MPEPPEKTLFFAVNGPECVLAYKSKFEMLLGQKIWRKHSLWILDLIEIRFKNLPALRSVQQHIFNDDIVKMEFNSYAVDRWPPYLSLTSKGISSFDKSVLIVFLCTPILTYYISKVCEAINAFQRFAWVR